MIVQTCCPLSPLLFNMYVRELDKIKGWKTMIVSKQMYRCGSLAWYQHECKVLEDGYGKGMQYRIRHYQ